MFRGKFFFVLVSFLFLTCFSAHAQNGAETFPRTWRAELPITYVKTSLSSPAGLHHYISSHGEGHGLKWGLGMARYLSPEVILRCSFQRWHTRFNAFTLDTISPTSFLENQEYGLLTFTGLALRIQVERSYYHFGIGLDASFGYAYKADLVITNPANGEIKRAFGSNSSVATDEFSQQINIVFSTGFRFQLSEQVQLMPLFEFSSPLTPLFHSNIYSSEPIVQERREMNVHAFLLQFGAMITYQWESAP
ncbi:MAG: hypothetical protein KDD36_03615 [Flavobacteriales bacterium]|nr:hypothetical protein [Flavobacteriales bacterium]